MTFKTIHLYPSIGVASFTELPRRVYRGWFALLIRLNVTGNTPGQAVSLITDTMNNGLVALRKQNLHVIAAHCFDRRDTLLTLAFAQSWQGDVGSKLRDGCKLSDQ